MRPGLANRSRRAVSGMSGLPKTKVLASAVSAVLGTSLIHSTAFAQDIEEITVTGSRIVRRDLVSASPIVTVETERFEQSSTVGVESVLNTMPQFVPDETQFDTSSTEPGGFSTPGIASVNLRGLGPNRNLVLVNGKRAQPANALLIVDVNTIPSAAIQRVETITGGASAVYGPDALAGVVNFILKDDFEGVEVDFQTGETVEGDGTESRASALIGFNSESGNGNVMLGVEATRRSAVTTRSRDWATAGWDDPQSNFGGFLQAPGYRANFNPPSQAAVDQLFSQYAAEEGFTYNPGDVPRTSEFYVNQDGSLFLLSQQGLNFRGPYGKMDLDGTGYTSIKRRADGNLEQNFTEGNISSPLDRRSLFGRATLDMTDNISAYVQANYTAVDTKQLSGYIPAITVWQGYVPRDGREIPEDLAFLLDSRTEDPNNPENTGPDAPWTVYRGLDFLGPEGARTQSDVYQIMAGAEGGIDAIDGSWDAYVSRGRTSNWYLGFG
ncbi:MAG: TonB-dependent receptor plug domain-containing protein, partial [Gammaproteobacteria bacterium]